MHKIWKYLTADQRKAQIVRRIIKKYRYRIPLYDIRTGEKYSADLTRNKTYDAFKGSPVYGKWQVVVGSRWHGGIIMGEVFNLHGISLSKKDGKVWTGE